MKFNLYKILFPVVCVATLGGCKATTALLVNFRDDTINQAPGSVQPTGTVTINPGFGSVVVAGSPNPDLPSNKWACITHPKAPSEETTMTCTFSRSFGNGHYGMVAAVYIPEHTGVVTIEFECGDPKASFFHLDFMEEGDVRIDDGATRFGHFPRNQSFVVSVALNIDAAAAEAEVSLLGGSASGSITVPINPAALNIAHRFEAVKFWMGYQHTGAFFVDDIVVTYKR